MTVLDVTHEHFDDYNLEQLAAGKCLHIYPDSMSRVAVEFVSAFICLHSPDPVYLTHAELSGEMSLEGLRLLVSGARWWYGSGASRAVLLSWLRCQKEQDEPAGAAHALGVVCKTDLLWLLSRTCSSRSGVSRPPTCVPRSSPDSSTDVVSLWILWKYVWMVMRDSAAQTGAGKP